MDSTKKKIVIVGGGFAGIKFLKTLKNNPDYHITLVDKNNYNFFNPLLYQVATGFLETSNISFPFRKFLQKYRNVTFALADLLEVLPGEKKVRLSTGELTYDYLVLATGTVSNYFGMENIKNNAVPLKTLDDALNLRNYTLSRMEEAVRATDETERAKAMTIAIVGNGPTGVELAGMYAEMAGIFKKDYPELAGHTPKICLIDGNTSVLSAMSKKAQEYTAKRLVKMGVTLMYGLKVQDYVNDQLIFANGTPVFAKTVIWAAGVTCLPIKGIPKESVGRGGRLLVDEYNTVNGFDTIFAVGDIAFQTADKNFPNGHPQMVQVAMQQGGRLAKNLIATSHNKPRKSFSYFDKGSMAIFGKNKAVADLQIPVKLFLGGFSACVIWLFIHLTYLVNPRSRAKTFYNWMVAYLTNDQVLRMIIRPFKEKQAG